MNAFESIFLNLGFGWTAAKAIPYILMILLGFTLVYTLHQRIEHRLKKWISMTLLCVLPFSIYFAVFPIYQGDFVNQYFKPTQLATFPEKHTLNVLVLPSCPYCHQTVQLMNQLKKRYPSLNIQYVVVAKSEKMADVFRSKLSKSIKVKVSKKPEDWIIMAQGGFPCMLLSEHKKIIYAWENDHFGVRAIDDIVSRLKK